MTETEIEIAKVLKAAGIEFRVDGCGCCRSPWISGRMPNGETFHIEGSALDTRKIPISEEDNDRA